MEKFEGQNILDFMETFPDDDACKAYLANLKWQDGFKCSKCGHTKGCLRGDHGYFCYSCHHVEIATAGTLFHKVKFRVRKAFCIAFEMATLSKGISSIQIGKRYGIRQATAWYFMQKVRKAMESSERWPMSGLVHVDEFVIGGHEERKQGRSYNTNKTKAIVAVEFNEKKNIKRVYAQVIDDYSSDSFIPFFKQHISKDAQIVTDKWTGYIPLKKDYNITQIRSSPKKNFEKIHLIIHQIKTWIRTVPVHVSKHHIRAYFNEYSFRINRSQFGDSIFHKLIERMVKQEPLYHSQILQKLNE